MARIIQSGAASDLVTDRPEKSLDEFCRACNLPVEHVEAYVAEGIIEAHGSTPAQWRFSHMSLIRMRRAMRLENDLGLNLAGVALALELMTEIEHLRRRLVCYEQMATDQTPDE